MNLSHDDDGEVTEASSSSSNILLRSFDVVEIAELMQREGAIFHAGENIGNVALENNNNTKKKNILFDFDIVENVLKNLVGKVVEESDDNGIDHFDVVERC